MFVFDKFASCDISWCKQNFRSSGRQKIIICSKAQKRESPVTMSPFALSVAVLLCLSATCTWALPKRPSSNGESSGAGEIPEEFPQDFRPFDGPLGKGSSDKEVFNEYDLDEGTRGYPEDYENEIPEPRPHEGGSKDPLNPDDRIPEEKHHEDEDERREEPSEDKPKGGEDEEKEEEHEDEDTHGVEDEEKHPVDEEETTQEGEEDIPLPLKPALFSFQQVNHYIKQLEKAMDHVFKQTLEEAALLNNTFANTTEEEVEVGGHKYKVQKSIIETGDEDKNSTLHIEAISAVNEDEAKKNKTKVKRSNPDAEPIQ